MSPEDLTLLLWKDYNRYLAMTSSFKARKYHKVLVLSDERLDLLKKAISFCCNYQLDPRRWLWTLFAIRGWRFPPTFKALVSKSALKKYATIDSSTYQNGLIKAKLGYDPRVDITTTVEGIKKRYQDLGEVDKCLWNIETETLGYHPKSKVCAVCWHKEACKIAINKLIGETAIDLRNQ